MWKEDLFLFTLWGFHRRSMGNEYKRHFWFPILRQLRMCKAALRALWVWAGRGGAREDPPLPFALALTPSHPSASVSFITSDLGKKGVGLLGRK